MRYNYAITYYFFSNKYLIFYFIFLFNINISLSLPVAVIHGFRQSCKEYELTSLTEYIGHRTSHYSRCIETGGGSTDISRSFRDQAKEACRIISEDEHYIGEFAIVSISQGGVLARYVIEKCDMQDRHVKVFVSIGGPLAGTHQLPHCLRGVTCHILNSLADWFVYKGYVQDTMGPAGYFRVSNHLSNFKSSSSLLLDVNNQGEKLDPDAKARFSSLDKLVLIAFKRDTMITPKYSAHFGEYNKKHEVVDMKDTESYKKDLFGLKTLDEAGKITYFWLDEKHCWYSYADVDIYIIPFVNGS